MCTVRPKLGVFSKLSKYSFFVALLLFPHPGPGDPYEDKEKIYKSEDIFREERKDHTKAIVVIINNVSNAQKGG